MTEVLWSGPAALELEAALDYIALDNREAADRLAGQVFKAVSRLQEFPSSGRMVPELDDARLREIVREPFRVIYQQHNDTVEILAVVRAEQEPDFTEIQGRRV